MIKRIFCRIILFLSGLATLNVFVSCWSLPHLVIDASWREYLFDFSWFTLNGEVCIMGGYHSEPIFYTEDWNLFSGVTRNYHYIHHPARKVYRSADRELLFDLQSSWPENPLYLEDGRLITLKGQWSTSAVLRDPRYFAEMDGAVYCIAGTSPGYPMEEISYGDVWRSEDGLHWERILEKGPWTGSGETLRMHRLHVIDGRIWLTGGFNETGSMKAAWSTDDGIHWIREYDFSGFTEITRVYSFRGTIYLRGRLPTGRSETWKKPPGGAFVRVDGPWEGAYNGDPRFFEWKGKLWAATNSGLLVTGDGENWTELFNSPDFDENVAVVNGRLCRTDLFLLDEKYSYSDDGLVWTWPGSEGTYDFIPAADIAFGDPYDENLAVEEWNGALWLVSGHPDGIWKSSDGLRWERVETSPVNRFPPRIRFASTIFRNRLWIFGGVQVKPFQGEDLHLVLNDVWSTADGINWQQEPDPHWLRRNNSVATVRGRELYLSGGSSYGNDYREIWKTTDGIQWEAVCHYPDLYEGDEIRPDFQNTIIFRDNLWLFDCYINDALLIMSPDGEWLYREFPEGGYRHPDLDNLAIRKNRFGRDVVFAWKDGRLWESDDIVNWKEIPYTMDPPGAEVISWPYPVLKALSGDLFLVCLDGNNVSGIRIIPDKF
jgi:hypothetical protein